MLWFKSGIGESVEKDEEGIGLGGELCGYGFSVTYAQTALENGKS